MQRPNLIIPGTTLTLEVPENTNYSRIDLFLTNALPAYSRSFFQKLIQSEHITRNNIIITKTSIPLKPQDIITVHFPIFKQPDSLLLEKSSLGVKILYEHPDFLIVYKPPHLMVHSAPHKPEMLSLVDWLTHHFKELKTVGSYDRPGIVHRLDKDTSGILIIPRNNYSHALFSDMFKQRKIEKTYLALVSGHPPASGIIDFPISRDSVHKHKMTHKQLYGRESTTNYTVLEYFPHATLVQVKPITGRTHQIRVHFTAIGHPLIGDTTYGTSSHAINRQALHAYHLLFNFEGHIYGFWYTMPQDMQNLIYTLRQAKTTRS